jgi:hypothetical protein
MGVVPDFGLRVVLKLRRVFGFVSGVGDAVPLVEALVSWEATRNIADMPLTEHSRAVTGTRKELGHCDFPIG